MIAYNAVPVYCWTAIGCVYLISEAIKRGRK